LGIVAKFILIFPPTVSSESTVANADNQIYQLLNNMYIFLLVVKLN
jgi:hypothetical protein